MRRVALFYVLCTSFQCLAPGKTIGVPVSAFDLWHNVTLVDVYEDNLTDRCWRKREEELDGLSRTLLWNLTWAWMPHQSCLTLHDPVDRSPPGSSVHGILLARILELVAIPPPGDLPDPGIEPASPESPALQADSLPLSHQESPCFLEVMPKQQVVVSSRLVVMWNPKPYQ